MTEHVRVLACFLSPTEVSAYRLLCEAAVESVKAQVVKGERSRVRRWGWTYGGTTSAPLPAEPWPGWVEDLRSQIDVILKRGMSDAITLNEYPPGNKLAPHADSPWFEDEVGILSLGECVFATYDGDPREKKGKGPAGELVETVRPPVGSLIVMSKPIMHSCEAVGKDVRYSLVFRRRRRT